VWCDHPGALGVAGHTRLHLDLHLIGQAAEVARLDGNYYYFTPELSL
jgi:hypothetical protein